MKRELERALKAAGGKVRALAEQLGVSPSTVRRWRRKGVPKRGTARQKLAEFKERRKKARVVARDKRQALAEMLREARKQGLIPKRYASSSGPRVGAQTVGYRWTFRVAEWASLPLLAALSSQLEKLRGSRQYWQVILQIAQYGDGELYGDRGGPGRYSTVNFQGLGQDTSKLKDMGKTLVEASASSPRLRGKRSLIPALSDLFEDFEVGESLLRADADTTRIETFIQAMTVYNYNLRTAQERRDYESNQRRERRRRQWRKTKRVTKKSKPPGRRRRKN